MSFSAPSPRIIEYSRQLSASQTSVKNVNLRHLADLSASDLTYLPQDINSLWIGPGFRSSINDIIRFLPTGLRQLDLDLTAGGSGPTLDAYDEQFLMSLLFERAVSLESLSLRAHGSASVFAVAKNLPNARQLQTLDFRSNHMGDNGVHVLCQSMLTYENNQGVSPVQNLIVSWNNVTDVGVSYLCEVLKSKFCQLKTLDLSCNDEISDVGFAKICDALRYNKSLERLTMFSCPQITNARLLKDLLVEHDTDSLAAASGTNFYNYTLKYVDLGATRAARTMKDVMEQIKFGLALNREGRLQLRCAQDDFFWILQSNLEDDEMSDGDSANSSVQWWRPAHELVQYEDPLEDLSISFYFLRQTSAFWTSFASRDYSEDQPIACD